MSHLSEPITLCVCVWWSQLQRHEKLINTGSQSDTDLLNVVFTGCMRGWERFTGIWLLRSQEHTYGIFKDITKASGY